jgi:hypothetical protein
MNAPANLSREFVEARGSELAGGLSYWRRQRRRYGEMISRMQRDGFIDDPQIAVEMFKLATHPVEPAHHGAVIYRFAVRTAQKLLERSADQERLRDAPTPRFGQEPRGGFF